MIKKLFTVLITTCLVLSLCSCSNEKTQEREVIKQITDGAGRTVNVYADADKNTAASVYFVAAPFFVALKISDRVLAVNTRNAFWANADDGLHNAGTVGKGTVDLEKLASYNPTVLVHRSNDPETIEAVEKLGIDTICITVENAQDIIDTLNILGSYFGVEENAEKAINWFNSKIDLIDSIVETIPDSEKKTAILIGGDLGRVAGKDMLQSWMIEKAGGIPVVEEYKNHNWVDIGVERVFSYNPEYIFSTSSAAKSYNIEDIYNDQAWSAMNAVINKNIYNIPTTLDSWDMPGMSAVLGVMYMLHTMHPDYFSIEDLEDEVDDYYRFMFGRCFDDELELDWEHFN
ncbi:MAG: ABC transporter substrate-binding protein [Erysipelotrichaceae bacterium]|nr:ABC transporter substrate-binding protein [Erysipelotrichaceae bacterium]